MSMDPVKLERDIRPERLLDPAGENLIVQRYRQATRRIVFLDYDGTLVPFSLYPQAAVPDERVLDRLARLAADPKSTVVLISGRRPEFLDQWFGRLSVSLIAEHGAFVREPSQPWTTEIDADDSWKQRLLPVLQRYADRCSGAFVENKTFSLVWHYRNADPELAGLRSQQLKDELRDLVSHDGELAITEGNKIIEVKKAGYDKGTAALKLLGRDTYDFILAIGDDQTDEDLFRVLPPEAISLKVGVMASLAKYHLKDQRQVAHLMNRLLE